MYAVNMLFLSIFVTLQGNNQTLFFEDNSDTIIMRWEFQEHCEHVFDPRTCEWAWPTTREPGGARFNPANVQPGDTIFVRDIDLFIKEMHALIEHPYIIVTHGEYRDTCQECQLAYLDDEKIIAWFAIHPPKSNHKKFFPLPLGIKQDPQIHKEKHEFSAYLRNLRTTTLKSGLCYANFDDVQNPSRKRLKAYIQDKPIFTVRTNPLPFKEYFADMAQFKFALSPRGWGPDCYRTWEALYVGTIPIVTRCEFDILYIRSHDCAYKGSQLDQLYEDLPILVIDDWTELTEEFLNQKYEEMISKSYSMRKLYAEYWLDKIYEVRTKFLSDYEATRSN